LTAKIAIIDRNIFKEKTTSIISDCRSARAISRI
jgi:hypothetical protein